MLQAADLGFAYDPARPVIAGVTLEVPAGAAVGVLGPNGSGKTTLLRLLAGTRRPTSGQVLLEGRPLGGYTRRALARRIAVVPQETQLAFDYTVLEMVLMGRHPHLGHVRGRGPRRPRGGPRCAGRGRRGRARRPRLRHAQRRREAAGGDRRGAGPGHRGAAARRADLVAGSRRAARDRPSPRRPEPAARRDPRRLDARPGAGRQHLPASWCCCAPGGSSPPARPPRCSPATTCARSTTWTPTCTSMRPPASSLVVPVRRTP